MTFQPEKSLLPMNLPILEKLGVLEQIEEIGIIKHGAEFNLEKSVKPAASVKCTESSILYKTF